MKYENLKAETGIVDGKDECAGLPTAREVYRKEIADEAIQELVDKVNKLEAEREISNSYDDAWKMAERIHELEKAIESRQKIIEELKAQNANLAKALSESAIGHDWLNEKELIEADNAAMKKRIKDLEHHVPKWHQCEHPNSEGFYDLPPESGEYIVQVRARNGRLETFATDFDADYSDWPELINGTVVIQWCEEPKPQIHTAKI